MNEFGFIPGPWTLDEDGDVVTEGGRVLVVLMGGDVPKEIDVANARLIAAAPDLLEALVSTRNRLHAAIVDAGSDPEYADIACEQADAAIAKAVQP